MAAGLAAVAASTLATAMAAVAGRQSDLALQPVELALRVGLLLGAPAWARSWPRWWCRAGARLAVVAVGLGVPLGPLLVLRLDRVRDFGLAASLLTVAHGRLGVVGPPWPPAGGPDRPAGSSAPTCRLAPEDPAA